MCRSTTPELAVHQGHHPIAGVQIARVPGTQETRYVVIRIGHGALDRPILDR
jgi:hypothetical protein